VNFTTNTLNDSFDPPCFATWAPNLYDYYVDHLHPLYAKYPNLKRNFLCSIFACATFNFGPLTITFSHTNQGNLGWGWCSVSALGPFNHLLGSHLILWDLGLVIDFPPGSTILIPSAVIRHSNTTIQDDERRYSFTQYAAGGLFRWVYNGFCSDRDFLAKASKAQKTKRDADRARRWQDGLAMFSKLSEFPNAYVQH